MLALLALGLVLALLFAFVQPLYTANQWVTDQLTVADEPSPNIVIGGIDDATLNEYGRLVEWPRRLHAQAIDNLSLAGARVISYDVIFTDTTPDDEVLATSMENAGNVVLAAVGAGTLDTTRPVINYQQVLSPVSPLAEHMTSVGHANLTPDRDGTVRRLPLFIQDADGDTYPAISLATLQTLFSLPGLEELPPAGGNVHLLGRDIPLDSTYRLRVNFASDDARRTYIPYADLIKGTFDSTLVRNKIVLIGMTATGDLDSWAVPGTAGKIPGVYIHATAMDTMLFQRFLTEAGAVPTFLIILLITAIMSLTLPRLKLRWGILLTVVLFVGYLVAGFFSFDHGYVMDMLYPLLALPLLFVGNVICYVVIERADQRFVKDLFGRYVSPEVAGEILSLADTGNLSLGGENREVTVLFADMRNFTQASARMTPEAVMEMLNTYLSIFIDCILENGGMINKFAGDNVMAIWNAPQSQNDGPRLAVRTAVEAQCRIAELHQDSPGVAVQFGVGINTGAAIAGNLGSVGRAEYTVIGDTVNLASRICGAAPGGETWIGPETYRQIAEYLEAEELAPQSFKGKDEPVVVYRVIGCQ
jgi:adenylate cyclase